MGMFSEDVRVRVKKVEDRKYVVGLESRMVGNMEDNEVELRLCMDCVHYARTEMFGAPVCMRLQTKVVHLVSGCEWFVGEELDCGEEREMKTDGKKLIIAWLKRRDKCGKEGKYWVGKSPV